MNEKISWFIPFKDAGVIDHITLLFRFLQFIQQVSARFLSFLFAE